MLTQIPELSAVFKICNQDGVENPKSIDCIRVDGACDKGPSHLEVQYWWTEWHVNHNKLATLVTMRSSGSSYLE